MSNVLESILTDLPPPTVGEEKAQRENAAILLRQLFRANPLRELSAIELTACVGPNYRSRIAELRGPLYDMNITLVRKFTVMADGKKRADLGSYLWTPYKPLGRDPGIRVDAQQNLPLR